MRRLKSSCVNDCNGSPNTAGKIPLTPQSINAAGVAVPSRKVEN